MLPWALGLVLVLWVGTSRVTRGNSELDIPSPLTLAVVEAGEGFVTECALGLAWRLLPSLTVTSGSLKVVVREGLGEGFEACTFETMVVGGGTGGAAFVGACKST